MDKLRQFRRWLQALIARAPGVHSSVMQENGSTSIADGVDYSLPYLLPGWLMREAHDNPRVMGALQESLQSFGQEQTYNNQFGNPYRSVSDLPVMPTTEDPLREWDWATRERVLSNCHAAFQRNPLANAAVNFTTDFVIGEGFNITYRNTRVKNLLQSFIDNPDNAIRKYERQSVNDLQVDGEIILRFFGEGDQTVVVPQRPWELHWIETEKGFYRRPLAYRFQRFVQSGDAPLGMSTETEDVPASDIHFMAINDHAYELRGRPELYRVLPWLKADKDFIEDRSRQNRWRGALLWHVRVANATPGTIAAVVNRWRKPPSPGSAYVSTTNEEVLPLTNAGAASDAAHDGRAIRLMTIIGMRLPEYFFADGQNANLATATKQELPALTKFDAFQKLLLEQLWIPVFRRVIQNAVDAGLLPEMVDEQDPQGNPVYEPVIDGNPEREREISSIASLDAVDDVVKRERIKQCKTIDAFEVTYAPVTTEDLVALVNMLSVATSSRWISNQTAAERLGFDTMVERRRVELEAETERNDIARGLKSIPPEQSEDTEAPENAIQQKADKRIAQQVSTPTSAQTDAGAARNGE